jgi:hypothetical protein
MKIDNKTVTELCEALWRHDEKTITGLATRVDPNGKDRWAIPISAIG